MDRNLLTAFVIVGLAAAGIGAIVEYLAHEIRHGHRK
jgi:hypothetical protein